MTELGWLETLSVGAVLTVLVAIGVLIKGLSWIVAAVRPMVEFWHTFMEDWGGVPARDGVAARPGVMSQLGTLRCDVEGVKDDLQAVKIDAASASFHSQPNHGSSSYDALMRELELVHKEIRESKIDRQELHADVAAITELLARDDDTGAAV